ncbi:MAG TPA: hypothetical protein VE111_16310 [Bradyrhizobium sp.]|nr:hypothetical protein [Bradyrhizobium sp.]
MRRRASTLARQFLTVANQPYFDGLQSKDTDRASLATVRGHPFVETHFPALAMMALVGFCGPANAQALCPELTRLRSEASEAVQQMMGAPTSDRCAAYIRFSMAWGAIARYANDHRELCDISLPLLSDFEKRYREAVNARENVCAGRPIRPFPPDINQR